MSWRSSLLSGLLSAASVAGCGASGNPELAHNPLPDEKRAGTPTARINCATPRPITAAVGTEARAIYYTGCGADLGDTATTIHPFDLKVGETVSVVSLRVSLISSQPSALGKVGSSDNQFIGRRAGDAQIVFKSNLNGCQTDPCVLFDVHVIPANGTPSPAPSPDSVRVPDREVNPHSSQPSAG